MIQARPANQKTVSARPTNEKPAAEIYPKAFSYINIKWPDATTVLLLFYILVTLLKMQNKTVSFVALYALWIELELEIKIYLYSCSIFHCFIEKNTHNVSNFAAEVTKEASNFSLDKVLLTQ